MKLSTNRIQKLSLCLSLASCLLLSTGCKETLELQSKAKHTKARVIELATRAEELRVKLEDLRKAMPGGTTAEEAGRQMAARATADLQLLDTQIAQAQAHYKESQVLLANLKKEIANQAP